MKNNRLEEVEVTDEPRGPAANNVTEYCVADHVYCLTDQVVSIERQKLTVRYVKQ